MLVSLSEFVLQSFDLLLESSYDFHFGINIFLRLIAYICGSCRIIESRNRLGQIFFSGRDASDHQTERVASKGVLQKRGQFRVTIGHVLHVLPTRLLTGAIAMFRRDLT